MNSGFDQQRKSSYSLIMPYNGPSQLDSQLCLTGLSMHVHRQIYTARSHVYVYTYIRISTPSLSLSYRTFLNANRLLYRQILVRIYLFLQLIDRTKKEGTTKEWSGDERDSPRELEGNKKYYIALVGTCALRIFQFVDLNERRKIYK